MSSERHPLSSLEQPAWELLRQRLQAVRSFLSVALPIANAHTGDFYTRGVWDELVCSSPEAVLAAFTRHHPPEQRHPEPTRTWELSRPLLKERLATVTCLSTQYLAVQTLLTTEAIVEDKELLSMTEEYKDEIYRCR